MEMCNNNNNSNNFNFNQLCYIDFYINLVSLISLIINCVCFCFLAKEAPSKIKKLLRLHNARSVLFIVLCLISLFEIGVGFMIRARREVQLSPYILFFMSIISTSILVRVIEVKTNKSATQYLYAVVILEIFQFIIRTWKYLYLQNYLQITDLNLFIQVLITLLLLGLCVTDGTTIYLENSSAITSKSCDPTILSKENISYKNPYSTFLSKTTFWWITELFWKGFFQPLELKDLGNLCEKDSSRYHYDQFLFIYQSFKNKQVSLWTCYIKSCWKMFIAGGLFKLFGDLCGLVGPLSISYIVDYINNEISNGTIANPTENITANIVVVMQNDFNATDYYYSIYYPSWQEFISNGWIMSFIVLIAFILQGTFSQASTNLVNIEGIKIKNALQGLIYRKTLTLNCCCFFNQGSNVDSNGNDNADDNSPKSDAGTITNLMSDDTLNVMSFFWIIHYVWSIPVKISIVVYFLYTKLGVSSLIGSIICIVTMLPLQFLVGKKMSSNCKKAAKCADERLKKINEVLLGIKLIKLNALEKIFQEKISDCRKNELHYLNIDAFYWTLMTFLTHASSILITIVTFAVYTLINDGVEFNASNVFTALALFNQLTVPLFIFPITIPIIISAIISTKRIKLFLSQNEIEKEFMGIRNMARILSKSDASFDLCDENKKLLVEQEENDKNRNNIINGNTMKQLDRDSSNQINFNDDDVENQNILGEQMETNSGNKLDKSCLTTDETLDLPFNKIPNNQNKIKLKQHQLSTKTKTERNRLRTKSISSTNSSVDGSGTKVGKTINPFILSDDYVVCIRDSQFSWNGTNNKNLLKIDSLSIPKGVLTVIVGPCASGKSSLVAALLKEMTCVAGTIQWNKYSTIAYASQQPWMLNGSIRDNILFGEPYRPKRYERVIESCSLKPEIELMPKGDLTDISGLNLNLSGGQRQRLSIARALYSSANVVILDDPLSSLDNEVASLLFEKSIKRILLKSKRTTILVTQKIQLVYNADYIVAMENNGIRVAGTMKEIKERDPNLVRDWDLAIATENAKESQLSALSGRTARERWKLFKNITRLGLQRTNLIEEENNLSSNTSLYTPFKRTSSVFGSRHLTHDLVLPIDERYDEDIDFNQMPEMRKRYAKGRELKSVFRVHSLQLRQSAVRAKLPVSRITSSPTTFQCPTNETIPEEGGDELGRGMSFRKFLRRMSSKRRQTPAGRTSIESLSHYRDKRKLQTTTSIKSINEEEPNVHPPVERNESNESKNSEENEDENSIKEFEDDEIVRLKCDEERKYGKIPTHIYVLYWRSCGLSTLGIFFMSTFLWQAFRIYTDVWLRDWTNNNNDFGNVKYYFTIYVVLSVLCIILALISTPCGQLAGSHSRKLIHEQLVDSLLKNSLHFFQVNPVGRIINRFSFDMAIIDKKISTTFQRLLQFVLLCVCAVLINTMVTPWFILLTIPIFAVYYVVQRFYRCSTRELQRIESITSSPIISHFGETIQGLTTIRAYNQEARFMELLFKRMESNNVASVILNSSNRWLGIALDYLGAFIVFAAIFTSLISSYVFPENIQSSMVGLAINYTLLIPIYLNWVVKLFADMEMYFGAFERIRYYADSFFHEDRSLKKDICKSVPISWPQKGNIVYENVSLKYENQTENIISNLSLSIPTGQRIGICGKSGSGKSTLAISLFGVMEIVSGRILIDDVDIATIPLDELRSRLSIIPQDVTLFSGTVRENLDPRGHFSDLELWNSLEIAQMKEIITKLPYKLDTYIAEGDSSFSLGQRQLFCLARAVLKGSICLVLDEATSALDSETEKKLLEAANKAFQGRTIITIAHRLYSLLDYDRIILIENGKIIEDGNPKELKMNPNSIFTTMLNAFA